MLEGSYCRKGDLSKFFYLNSTTDIGVIELNENIRRYNILNAKTIGNGIKSFIGENTAGKYFISMGNIDFIDTYGFEKLHEMWYDMENEGKNVNMVISPDVTELLHRCDFNESGKLRDFKYFSLNKLPEEVNAELELFKTQEKKIA